MIGTDWLRRKAAGRSVPDIAITLDSSGPNPVAVLTIEDPVTEADVDRIRNLVQIVTRPQTPDGEPMHCPCGVIYSRCYYGH